MVKEIKENIFICPSCKSNNIKVVEKRDDNGIIGPGYSSWIIDSYLSCKNCGTRFDKIK